MGVFIMFVLMAIVIGQVGQMIELRNRVKELEESLQGFIDLANESQGVMGWHLNGDVLPWEDVDQLRVANDLLTPKGTT